MHPIYNQVSRSPVKIDTSGTRKAALSVGSGAQLSSASTACGTPSPNPKKILQKANGYQASPPTASSKLADVFMKDAHATKLTTTSEMIEPINLVANQ